jgi:hypothetical protein
MVLIAGCLGLRAGEIVDLQWAMREAHLIAFKEIERLNLRIAELESHVCQPAHERIRAAPFGVRSSHRVQKRED